MLCMSDMDLKDKRVLIREDLNVTLDQGKILSDARIKAALPTLRLALEKGAAVMVMSHLGRPKEGFFDSAYSLQPVADALTAALGFSVPLVKNWIDGIALQSGQLVLCENVRFSIGEKADCPDLAKRMADLCDLYVMDAFGTAHRAHASTHGVALKAKLACAGPLLQAELNALEQVMKKPKHPLVAIVGGSKVSTKLDVLTSLSQYVDTLIVGGGIANTFLAATGWPVGQSLYEPNLLETAKSIMAAAKLPLPTDVVVANEISTKAKAQIKPVAQVTSVDMILDIGPETIAYYTEIIEGAQTILWNGPVGVFEQEAFRRGSYEISRAIAQSRAYSVAGGGDTLAAIDLFEVEKGISYISTGGGAFLEFVEGRALPAVVALEAAAER